MNLDLEKINLKSKSLISLTLNSQTNNKKENKIKPNSLNLWEKSQSLIQTINDKKIKWYLLILFFLFLQKVINLDQLSI